MASLPVRAAGPQDEARVLAVITLAFAGDPFARWVTPDAAAHLATMPRGARAFGGNGFAHGTVYFTEGGEGAAMWLPPGVEPDSERLGALIGSTAPPDRLPDLMAVFERMAHVHPQEPHWYLPLIGVDPLHQNRGLGAALMRHALARCDAEGLPAYLESSNPRNMPLYRRFDFEVVEVIQIGAAPPLVAMLRRPRPA